MVTDNVLHDEEIVHPTLVKIRSSIDLNHHTVKICCNGITEAFNLGYEQDFEDDTEDDFISITEFERDIADESNSKDSNRLLLAISEKKIV